MSPVEHHDETPRECITLSAAEKQERFATLMQRLKNRTESQRSHLRAQASRAIEGYEVYARGQEFLEQGDYAEAVLLLQIADAVLRVPGAQQSSVEADEAGREQDPFVGPPAVDSFMRGFRGCVDVTAPRLPDPLPLPQWQDVFSFRADEMSNPAEDAADQEFLRPHWCVPHPTLLWDLEEEDIERAWAGDKGPADADHRR
jgi:hypothetical protein